MSHLFHFFGPVQFFLEQFAHLDVEAKVVVVLLLLVGGNLLGVVRFFRFQALKFPKLLM